MLTNMQIQQRTINNKRLDSLLVAPRKSRPANGPYGVGRSAVTPPCAIELFTEFDHYCFGQNSVEGGY